MDMAWVHLTGSDPSPPHRVLPLGEPSIAVHRKRNLEGVVESFDIVVCAQYSRAQWHMATPNEDLISYRLMPEIAAHSVGIDPRDHCDTAPARLPPHLMIHFDRTKRCALSGSVEEVARALASDILSFAENHSANAHCEALAAQHLRACNGAVSISDIAAMLNVSERHLRRRFADVMGISPKAYARRLRLSAAAMAADRCDDPDWADIAAKTGFHDQAHLINEYRDLTGLTPVESFRERNLMSDFSKTALTG